MDISATLSLVMLVLVTERELSSEELFLSVWAITSELLRCLGFMVLFLTMDSVSTFLLAAMVSECAMALSATIFMSSTMSYLLSRTCFGFDVPKVVSVGTAGIAVSELRELFNFETAIAFLLMDSVSTGASPNLTLALAAAAGLSIEVRTD